MKKTTKAAKATTARTVTSTDAGTGDKAPKVARSSLEATGLTGVADTAGTATIVRPDDAPAETTTTTTTRKAAAKAPVGDTQTMTILHVNIVRDPMVKIAAEIFEHELPILEALNGEDNIEVVSEEEVEVANFNVVDEYDRLRRKYRKLDQGSAIDALGRTPATLAKRLGIAYDRDAIDRRGKRSQALIKDGGKATAASAPARATKAR
jgi:hypothetical protein